MQWALWIMLPDSYMSKAIMDDVVYSLQMFRRTNVFRRNQVK